MHLMLGCWIDGRWFRTLLSSSYAGILKNLILILLSFQTHVTIKKTSQAPWGSGAIFVTYYYPQFISIINVHKKCLFYSLQYFFQKKIIFTILNYQNNSNSIGVKKCVQCCYNSNIYSEWHNFPIWFKNKCYNYISIHITYY